MLAIIWFVLGGYLLVDAWNEPDGRLGPMPGFVAMALAAYNLVRWWAARQLHAARRDEPISPLHRPRRPPDANDHLFRLEDDPISLPPPSLNVRAGAPESPGSPPRDGNGTKDAG